jgi:hypothetical protein
LLSAENAKKLSKVIIGRYCSIWYVNGSQQDAETIFLQNTTLNKFVQYQNNGKSYLPRMAFFVFIEAVHKEIPQTASISYLQQHN